jgi:hypothetical protein
MNNDLRTLPCPHCKEPHLVPIGNNRSKCKGCRTWLQINSSGNSLQDYFVAKNNVYLSKKGYTNVLRASS